MEQHNEQFCEDTTAASRVAVAAFDKSEQDVHEAHLARLDADSARAE
jgi:hypothetical protein